MNLKTSAIIALVLTLIFITSWEFYWRSQGRVPTVDDDKYLFAASRAKVDKLTSDDIIIVGSSRVMFNIQLDEFEKLTGVKPIQLANVGSSPLPVFHDIVNNTDFKGTVIVGVTPGLFFSTTYPKASPIEWPQSRVDYFHKRTLSERFNHWLSIPLQENFVFIATHGEVLDDNVDLKTLLNNVEINNRTGRPRYPEFFEFGSVRRDRNVRMTVETSTDTVAANKIKKAWKFILGGENPPPDKNSTTAFFEQDAKTFKARGGKIIFVRSPSSGFFEQGEAMFLPRERFYDSLLTVVNSPGYHYQDYEQLKTIDCCPEWSHLSAENADTFTKELVKIMLNDNVLPTTKAD
ncbi:hypothetical protein [Winogradskyella sp. 3972H.M.0a.05]|uniref:hypothetical protein n=1 Tax=Winogradskyella sp. 3972H.M.0a.05 TaxID=2950277 RepID=UPI0033947923